MLYRRKYNIIINNNKIIMQEGEKDDGSLNFLNIERNKDCREFNCRVIKQINI